uniref:Periplasmic heavy metal sensor n=1 Tax=Desulfatirhabdium butyrativorans TaxID=340467 RepID=A0A7C4MR55_9BACT
MNRDKWVRTSTAVMLVGLLLWTGSAFAGKNKGFGPGMGAGNPPCFATLTADQQKQFTELQQKFYNDTQSLRQQIAEKRAELNLEMTKATPDVAKAQAIQKELSALQAELDQQHVAHMIEMKKICPTMGAGRGMGMMHGGHMMGMGMMGPPAATAPKAQ